MFYTPEKRDKDLLPFDPLKAIIAPRPIGWISTLSKDGIVNLAPYSFFNMVGNRPPLLMFSSEGMKDSATNAIETGEFVHNFASDDLKAQMNLSSIDAPSDIDEFDHAGLEKTPSNLVNPPRVLKAKASLECKTVQSIRLKDLDGNETGAVMVIGQIIGVHIDDEVVKNGRFDVTAAAPVTRLGYMDFASAGPLEELNRPQWNKTS